MEIEGNNLAKTLEEKERTSYPEMDENRCINFGTLIVQYASPHMVIYNFNYQKYLLEELTNKEKEKRGLLSKLYNSVKILLSKNFFRFTMP